MTRTASLSMAGPGPAMVVPSLRPGQIVVLDTVNGHRHPQVRALIEATGCEVRYLSSYSPAFTPSEQAFAKLKGSIRKVEARTNDALVAANGAGLSGITA